MRKYYILRADGTSIFEQPYSEDFIFHCLINLLDRSDEQFRLCWFGAGVKLVKSDFSHISIFKAANLIERSQ